MLPDMRLSFNSLSVPPNTRTPIRFPTERIVLDVVVAEPPFNMIARIVWPETGCP